MTIRIDQLNSTLNPQRDHEFPAIRDGQTVKLRTEQVLAVGGPDDPQALKDFSNVDPATGRAAIGVNAANTPFHDSVTNFGLDPEDLNVQKAIEATKDYIDTVAASITVTQSDVRQTVNTGPVDSNGRAAFLAVGSGLQVVTTGVGESNPLNIAFGDGFNGDGKRDVVVVLDSGISWDSLPDNEDDISLYIRVDRETGAVSTEASLLAPIYSAAEPSAPATGQKWYPTDHRHPMREWDGAAWNNDDLIICVGQCATSGGSVASARSYAYQGRVEFEYADPGRNSVVVSNHNIGAKLLKVQSFVFFTSSGSYGGDFTFNANEYYSYLELGVPATGRTYAVSNSVTKSILRHRTGEQGISIYASSSGGGSTVTSISNMRYVFIVERAF